MNQTETHARIRSIALLIRVAYPREHMHLHTTHLLLINSSRQITGVTVFIINPLHSNMPREIPLKATRDAFISNNYMLDE